MDSQPSFWEQAVTALFPATVTRIAKRAAFAANEYAFTTSNSNAHDIGPGTRLEHEWDSREAWIRNPYAHRILSITTAHILGRQLSVTSSHPDINDFIQRWWAENELELMTHEIVEELLRAGEILFVLTPDQWSARQYLTPIPGHWLSDIITDRHNYRREIAYTINTATNPSGQTIYHPDIVTAPSERVAVYYAINRPLGSPRTWGGILTPVLPAIERYNEWLRGRTAMNEAASKYAWDITATQDRLDEVEKKFFAGVPAGSVYVHTPQESIKATSPTIASWDARHDGQAMRQTIATGSNTAMHMLGDVTEGSRAGAREAALPSYRIYTSYQTRIATYIKHLVRTAVTRAHLSGLWQRHDDAELPKLGQWGLSVQTADLTREDNEALAKATDTIVSAITTAVDRQWLDDATAREWLYRFAGENYDPGTIQERMENPPSKEEAEDLEAQFAAAGRRPD